MRVSRRQRSSTSTVAPDGSSRRPPMDTRCGWPCPRTPCTSCSGRSEGACTAITRKGPAYDPDHRLKQSGTKTSMYGCVECAHSQMDRRDQHHLGKLDDSCHEQLLHTPFAPGENGQNHVHLPLLLHGRP